MITRRSRIPLQKPKILGCRLGHAIRVMEIKIAKLKLYFLRKAYDYILFSYPTDES